ncbi:MAG TPA: hypothetical protein VFW44_19975, partial [Bryobacteraceae bacterium]|nr:hypothetical protein [Bryobacteraceae bacterium]
GSKTRLEPPLLAYSNGGQKLDRIAVDTETSVTAIGGTTDGNVLYVATPDGIFVSGNHGASWSQAIPLVPQGAPNATPGTVSAISVDQIDPSRAWIAASNGLFQLNTAGQVGGEDDFGMAIGPAGHVNATAVQIDPVDHLNIYATTSNPNFLYKTSDAGANWHQLSPAYPGEPAPQPFPGTNITFTLSADGSDLYVIDNNGVLLKSTDGGVTWQQLANQLYGAKSITLDPKNPVRIFVVDNFGLAESTDGGETFAIISPKLQNGNFIQSFAMDSTGSLYFITYNQIEVSTDNGKTWKMLSPRPNPHVLVGLGGKVLMGVDSTKIPFVTKWTPDGSKMLYSTFFGGSYGDTINAIAVDPQGEAIIAGEASSPDFPVTKTIAPAGASPYSAFVAKLSADGSKAVYSSLIGGSQGVFINAVAIDSSGAPYITGNTSSPDFPATPGALQPKLPTAMCQRPGILPFQASGNLETNAFVTKLSADGGHLVYSTFLTAPCGSIGKGITLDSLGETVVVGLTTSPDFPVSANAYQPTFPGGPAASVNFPNPVEFGFVSKLSAAGDKLVAGSFIGGGFMTEAEAVTLDTAGDAYITGSTSGITPGATPGAYQTKLDQSCFILGIGPTPPSEPMDAFLLKLDSAFTHAQFLTYIGTGCTTGASSIVLQPSGNVWIGGLPYSGFPMVEPYALTGSYFVSEFNPDASQLLFSTFSDGPYLAQDPAGDIYVSGSGQPVSGPPKNSPYPYSFSSASLAKIDPNDTPPVIINSVGPSATYQKVSNPTGLYGGVVPGELIEIAGEHLGPADTLMAKLDETGRLPFVVSGTSVAFNDYLAPIISVQDGLIVCFAPFEISGPTAVTVDVNGAKSTAVRVAVSPSAPYILSIVNQDGTPNSASHPAPQGSVIVVYVTGLGITTPLSQDGSVSYAPLPKPVAPVVAGIGQNQVQPQAILAAYGLVSGISQVNIQVPKADYSHTPVYVRIDGAEAQVFVGK